MSLVKICGAVAAISILAAPGARAQPAADMQLSLGYDGRLLFKVLDIEIEQRANATGFSSTARLVSTGILRLVKHIDERASSQGRIADGAVRPWQFDYQRFASKSHRHTHVTWSAQEVTMTTSVPFPSLGDPPATLQQKLAAADPLTQLMRVTLDAGRPDACRGSRSFFDGRQLYALDFSNRRPAGPSATQTKLGLINAYRCDVRYREVAGYKKSPSEQEDGGLKKPVAVDFAQIGPDGPWVVSRMEAPTPLGYAVIELKRLSLSGKAPGA